MGLMAVLSLAAPGGQGRAAASAWHPKPALKKQLAAPALVEGYQIQPPRGYRLVTQAGPGGSVAHVWVGPPHANKVRPYLMVVLLTPPPAEAHKYSLNQILAKMLGGIRRQRGTWSQTLIEHGTVNGLKFARAYWSGTDAPTGLKMHGFGYVAQDGPQFAYLSSQDVEPYDKTALPLAEAAALTFRKR